MSRLRLLVSAEPFGFGPIGKLMSILEQLKSDNYHICFLGCGTALTAAELNKELFTEIIELNINRIDQYDLIFHECDAVLSVMEPSIVIMGFSYKKKTFYVDSLSFLWSSDLDRNSLEAMKSELIDRPSVGCKLVQSLKMHDSQALAHYLADTSFVQRHGETVKRKILIPNIIYVQAIVPYFLESIAVDRCDLLVTLSGQLSVFSSPTSSLSYVYIILKICEKISELTSNHLTINIVINPNVLHIIPPEIRERFTFCSLSHKQMNEKIKNCNLLLAPPGLTTALESTFLKIPYMLLPDQHYAHHLNRRILDPCQKYGPINFQIKNLPVDPREATVYLQRQARDTLLWPEHLSLFTNSFANQVCRAISSRSELDTLKRDQEETFENCFGGFKGAEQIKETISSRQQGNHHDTIH